MRPKAAQIIAGGRPTTEDEKLFRRSPRPAFLDSDPWRALRILSEFVDGFDALAAVGPAITVFGYGPDARRTSRSTSWREPSGGSWPRRATPSSPAAAPA